MEDEELIQCVQKYSVLYDRSDPNHSRRDPTKKAWAEISAVFGERVVVVKKRWRHLRDCFRKQQRFCESLKSEEWSAKKEKWPLYDSMTFLLPYMEFGKTIISHGVSETHQSPDSFFDISEESVSVTFDSHLVENVKEQQNMLCQRPKRKRTMNNTYHQFFSAPREQHEEVDHEHFLNKGQENMLCQQPKRKRTINDLDHQFFSAPREQHEEDDHEHFLKSLLPTMRTLDPLAAMEFRHEVQGLLIMYIKKAPVQDMPSQSPGN